MHIDLAEILRTGMFSCSLTPILSMVIVAVKTSWRNPWCSACQMTANSTALG